MTEGLVRNIVKDKQYGFIISDGKEYFFHKSDVQIPFDELKPGEKVEFGVEQTKKGWRARNISRV